MGTIRNGTHKRKTVLRNLRTEPEKQIERLENELYKDVPLLTAKSALPKKERKILPPGPRVNSPLTPACDRLKSIQRDRVIVMKFINMLNNSLRAIVAGTVGYDPKNQTKEERNKIFKKADEVIEAVRKGTEDHKHKKIILTALMGIDGFVEQRKDLEKRMVAEAKELPIAAWVESPEMRGFGLLFLAIVVGECGDLTIAPNNYPNPARLWKRLGLVPFTGHNGLTLMPSTWRKFASRDGKLSPEEWEEVGYSPRRRSISFLIGTNIVKQNFLGKAKDAPPGPYRTKYLEAKAKFAKLRPDWAKDRVNKSAMIVATKKLLKDLWRVWNGRPVDAVYEAANAERWAQEAAAREGA